MGDAMSILLQCDYLGCKETSLWEAVLNWSAHKSSKGCDQERPSKRRKLDTILTVTDGDQLALLTAVAPFIRFGLMGGKYFATKVVPQNVLTKDETLAVLMYGHAPEQGCGPFSTIARFKMGIQIPYTLRMSTKWYGDHCANTCDALSDPNTAVGAGTYNRERQYIEALFDNPVVVTRMEIAPLDAWENELSSCHIQLFDETNNEWKVIQEMLYAEKGKIQTMKWNSLRAAKRVRIFRKFHGNGAISVGFWRIFGV